MFPDYHSDLYLAVSKILDRFVHDAPLDSFSGQYFISQLSGDYGKPVDKKDI